MLRAQQTSTWEVVRELVTTRIRGHATRLALPHVGEHREELGVRAEADAMGYLEFVELLLGEESGPRRPPVPPALKLSGLPHYKALDAKTRGRLGPGGPCSEAVVRGS